MTRRTERIAGELRGELARLLREEVTDPRVGFVTLTRVDVAPDLSHALVFWSALDDLGDPANAETAIDARQAGLESAAQFLRHRAAGSLPLRRMPALRFRYDPSLAQGSRTLELLREVAPGEDEATESESPSETAGSNPAEDGNASEN